MVIALRGSAPARRASSSPDRNLRLRPGFRHLRTPVRFHGPLLNAMKRLRADRACRASRERIRAASIDRQRSRVDYRRLAQSEQALGSSGLVGWRRGSGVCAHSSKKNPPSPVFFFFFFSPGAHRTAGIQARLRQRSQSPQPVAPLGEVGSASAALMKSVQPSPPPVKESAKTRSPEEPHTAIDPRSPYGAGNLPRRHGAAPRRRAKKRVR